MCTTDQIIDLLNLKIISFFVPNFQNGNVKYIPPSQTACLNNMKQAKAILSPVGHHTNFSSIPEEPATNGNFSEYWLQH
jgi:hypothetical protein